MAASLYFKLLSCIFSSVNVSANQTLLSHVATLVLPVISLGGKEPDFIPLFSLPRTKWRKWA